MHSAVDQRTTYSDLLLKLAREGRLSRIDSNVLCKAAFEIGRSDKIERDLAGARRTLEVHAVHREQTETAERERQMKAASEAAKRESAARLEVEKSLWEITEQRNVLLTELRDTKKSLQTTETAKRNAQQDARAAIRRVEQMQDEVRTYAASVEGQRSAIRETERQYEQIALERDRQSQELAAAREQIAQADGRRTELETRELRRGELLSRRKASVKKTIRYLRCQKVDVERRAHELACTNARLTDENAAIRGRMEAMRDTDRRVNETLQQSRKVFENVSAVLSEAGARFVRDALAAELQNADGVAHTAPARQTA